MKERIKYLIEYKANGSVSEFARITGLSRSTINNIVRLGTNSVSLLTEILNKLPEIDARWLLTGIGSPIQAFGLAYIEKKYFSHLIKTFELVTLIPYMTIEQLRRFKISVSNGLVPDFTELEIKELKIKSGTP